MVSEEQIVITFRGTGAVTEMQPEGLKWAIVNVLFFDLGPVEKLACVFLNFLLSFRLPDVHDPHHPEQWEPSMTKNSPSHHCLAEFRCHLS